MKVGEHVHLFATSRCNLDCAYCFGPDKQTASSNLPAIAKILAKNDVKMVTIGGGEPLLAKDLENTLEILKMAGIYISVHTNGLLLHKWLPKLEGLVDDIGLPIDSLDGEKQLMLRGEKFRETYDDIFRLAKDAQNLDIQVGWHTVFTAINYKELESIYRKISKIGFQYWRIYELNDNLLHARVMRKFKEQTNSKNIEKYKRMRLLQGQGSPEKGYSDCLPAHFLLTEEKMKKHRDSRIQFVAVQDRKEPYMFIEPNGDVRYYAWFSQYERRSVGNIFQDGFAKVKRKMQEIRDKGPEISGETMEEFVETQILAVPLWQNLNMGAGFAEELEEIKSQYWPKVLHLSELFEARQSP